MTCFDLDRYCERIGYAGGRHPNSSALIALHEAHVGAIAFENLDVLAGQDIALTLPELEAKLVGGGRGGYCFEQSTLFKAALEALGFTVNIRLARVRWKDNRRTPRSHMVLTVNTSDGPYLADVGFGGRGLLHPLPLVPGTELTVPDGSRYRFTPEPEGEMSLEGDFGAGWEPHYVVALCPASEQDVEVANYYVSKFPGSMFRNVLMVQRVRRARRALLVQRSLTLREGSQTSTRTLANESEVRAVLAEEFGLKVPSGMGVAPPSHSTRGSQPARVP